MRICKCGTDELKTLFRKNCNQCIPCYNKVRRQGFQKKIAIEQGLLIDSNMPLADNHKREYKHQWYLENKDRLSEENSRKYLTNRDARLKSANARYYNSKNTFSNMIRGAKVRAKAAELLFELDEIFIKNLYDKQNGKCALTHIDFVFEKEDALSRRPFAPSIDRMNSKLGYVKDNVRLVCAVVNLALNEFGDEIFDRMCKAYVENSIRCRQ